MTTYPLLVNGGLCIWYFHCLSDMSRFVLKIAMINTSVLPAHKMLLMTLLHCRILSIHEFPSCSHEWFFKNISCFRIKIASCSSHCCSSGSSVSTAASLCCSLGVATDLTLPPLSNPASRLTFFAWQMSGSMTMYSPQTSWPHRMLQLIDAIWSHILP